MLGRRCKIVVAAVVGWISLNILLRARCELGGFGDLEINSAERIERDRHGRIPLQAQSEFVLGFAKSLEVPQRQAASEMRQKRIGSDLERVGENLGRRRRRVVGQKNLTQLKVGGEV